jgi:U3 small nucleolar RNA-associated protein 18
VPITSASEEDDEFKDPNPPAWIDSDDERITVSLASNPRLRKLRITADEDSINGKEYTKRLRRQFERLYPVPEWADHSTSQNSSSRKKRRKLSNESYTSSSSSSDDDMTDDLSAQPLAKLLQSTTPLTTTASTTTRRKLRPEVIDIQRLKDIPDTQPSTITSLSFHPTLPILLSSCTSLLTLHHLSPTSTSPNPKLTSLHIPHTPLTTTSFHPSGTRIFFSARRRYFHIWDLPSGSIQKVTRVYGHAEQQKSMERFKISGDGRWMGLVGTGRKGGSVNILDAGTSQWVCEARVEGRNGVADFEWWNDGNGLTILGKGGEAVEYSVLERKVIGRWQDKGAFGGDRYVAVGSQSGIVNIYDRSSWRVGTLSERPVPVKVLDQLFTPISHLTFSPDGQFLVMASRWKRDALRIGTSQECTSVKTMLILSIVHLPSCTVYKNWPTSSTPLGRITAVAISPSSEMLAVANEQGKIRLWEIRA